MFGTAAPAGCEREQSQLLPARVDDYVHAENPVRFIEAFADGLDLGTAGFARVDPKMTGRPGYDPADLLKLYIYGYLNRVRSSRRLEVETHRNFKVIWLLRGLQPDFKTIADFRCDNRSAFKAVFREFVLLCRKLDLYGRELVAVDGTRLKAVNSRDRNFTREKVAKFLKTADERADRLIVEAKRWGSRLRFGVMLLFYRARGRFPRGAAEVDKDAVADLALRLGMTAPGSREALLPASDDRTLTRQRAEIRALLGFREATVADAEDLGIWLRDAVAPRTRDIDELTGQN